MKNYLESRKFYVLNEDGKLVYKVGEFETYSNCETIFINLELRAGWDYINPDENDVQGWCPANHFAEDLQFDIVSQYFIVEGMKEALEINGYTIMGEISPKLQDIINRHNEA